MLRWCFGGVCYSCQRQVADSNACKSNPDITSPLGGMRAFRVQGLKLEGVGFRVSDFASIGISAYSTGAFVFKIKVQVKCLRHGTWLQARVDFDDYLLSGKWGLRQSKVHQKRKDFQSLITSQQHAALSLNQE